MGRIEQARHIWVQSPHIEPAIYQPGVWEAWHNHFPKSKQVIPASPEIDTDNHLELYFKQMGVIPLLSRDEEVALAKRIEKGKQAQSELTQTPATNGESTTLKYMAQDAQAAREALSSANTRLVVSIAKQYQGRGVLLLDLIQEGNVGLMKAVDRFDYHQGYRFSTYATWWIRQAVSRAVSQQGRTIRIPVHATDFLSKIYKTNNRLEQELGRQPHDEEIAKELKKNTAKVTALKLAAIHPESLESNTGSDEAGQRIDFIADEHAPNAFESAAHSQLQEQIDQLLSKLPPRERQILELRFGIGTGEPHTLEQVAKIFGLSRERIRQLERLGLRRLRTKGSQQMLQDFKE